MKKPKPNPDRKNVRLQIMVTAEQKDIVDALQLELRSNPSELFRRAIDALREKLEREMCELEALELRMSGDNEQITKKQLAIKAFGTLANVALVAERIGVTSATIAYWMQIDAVFAQLAEEAQARAVAMVEGALFKKALEGHVSAMFGILNARHPDYGQIRNQMIQMHLAQTVDGILDVAYQFVPADSWNRFADAVGECVTEAARRLGKNSSKRKRG